MEEKNVTESEKLHEQLNEIANEFLNSNRMYEPSSENKKRFIISEDFLKQLQDNFSSVFIKLYHQSIKDNYFWQYCTSDVYKNYFDKNFNQFKKDFPESTFKDFIQNELNNLNNDKLVVQNEVEYYFKYYYSPLFFIKNNLCENLILTFLDEKITKNLKYSQKRKIEFLEEKLEFKKESITETEFYPDYSEIKHPERFVMLHELGIIDYLKSKFPVKPSEHKLAALLSTFTGMNKDNLYSMINGTKNKNHNNKITENSILEFERKLERLKIDPKFFRKDTK